MAGAGYKLFATGDVLTAAQVNTYLMQQTVMVFASSAARTTALSGVLAEGMVSYLQDTNTLEVYDGSAWVGATGDITGLTAGTGISISSATGPVPTVTNSMATEITAKGDLIVGTGSGTFDNLAAGSNGDTIVADSSTATGLRYQSGYNGNAIINGGMDIWQRGTSIASTAANLYTADRWCLGAGTTGRTVSRQSSGITGIQYAMRVQRDSGNTSTLATYLAYNLESADSYRFAGKTVTISFWARAGANFSPTSGTVSLILASSTGTDQNILNVWAGNSGIVNPSPVFTTSWQRFTYTGTVNSNATQLAFYFISSWIGTAGANDWFELTGVQLEVGSVATEFKRSNGSGGTIQGELAACQRYFQSYGGDGTYEPVPGFGISFSTTTHFLIMNYIQKMRTKPTFSVSAASDWNVVKLGTVAVTCTNVALTNTNELGTNSAILVMTTASSGSLGSDHPIALGANNTTNARLNLSAEL